MTAAWMVRHGEGGVHAQAMVEAGYMGVDFIGDYELTPYLGVGREAFQASVTEMYHESNPGKTKSSATYAVNSLFNVACDIPQGDIILAAPRAGGVWHHGIVSGDYEYHPGSVLPHRRRVDWTGSFGREAMSDTLAKAVNFRMTLMDLGAHSAEVARLTQSGGSVLPSAQAIITEVQEQLAFQMEKQLEEFLVHNWASTSLGRQYDIYEEAGQSVGQQYPSDTGPMDILAISKDRTKFLVVELKRGRASDAVVGQIQRYMGFVQAELLGPGQSVEGVIIAQEDDAKVRRALSMTRNIRFMKYRVEFHLEEA